MKERVKRLLIIGAVIFLSINLIWYYNYQRYKVMAKGYSRSPINYFLAEKNYSLSVAPPRYLRLQGSLSVTDNEKLAIIYWPGMPLLTKKKIGISIVDAKSNTAYRFYVNEELQYRDDSSMRYTDVEKEKIKYLIKKNDRKIKYLDWVARKEWNLIKK